MNFEIVNSISTFFPFSQDSSASETSLTSDKQNERLHANLVNLPPNTIEPPKSPIEHVTEKKRFFTCQKCDSVAFQSFDDLERIFHFLLKIRLVLYESQLSDIKGLFEI